MKQIIPIQKELLFKTKVCEITSISLEHTLSLKDDDTISGSFKISGEYKMTEGSINKELFDFDLPFDITLTDKYDKDSITIDIDNFYYEIVNNESLKVNIDIYIEGNPKEEPIEEEREEERDEELQMPPLPQINTDSEEEQEEIEENIQYEKPKNYSLNETFNIFENIDNADTYVTYHIYIVKENDTIDTIMDRYKVTKEDLELYNNLEEIKPGTKLIIPNKDE